MTTLRTLTSLILILTWQAASPGVADAQEAGPGQAEELSPREARQKARALERRFQTLFQEESFDEALLVIEQIIELDPREAHLFNLAMVHYHRGDKEASLKAFQRFLASNPKERGLVREAQRFVRILDRDVKIIKAARARAEEETRAAERATAEMVERAERAETAQAEAEAEAEAARQSQARAEAEAEKWREVVASAPVSAGAGKRTLGVSLALAGGLALGAGVFYGLDAMAANDEAESVTQWTVGHDWLIDRAETHQTRSLVFAIVGAGMIAGGATLYYLGEREARTPMAERVGITPSVTPDSAGVQLQGRF